MGVLFILFIYGTSFIILYFTKRVKYFLILAALLWTFSIYVLDSFMYNDIIEITGDLVWTIYVFSPVPYILAVVNIVYFMLLKVRSNGKN